VGVPVMVQFAFSVRPTGSAPEATEQVYGAVPPATPTVPVYGTPTVPAGGAVRVSVTELPVTVRMMVPVLVLAGLAESVAVIPTV